MSDTLQLVVSFIGRNVESMERHDKLKRIGHAAHSLHSYSRRLCLGAF
ncbi:MAG TPA: hypothetical protein VL866_03825 [Pyrinomonadaceae bacterium]|nr:hypothetical protein [Pyrinomonadaceae bacterium]